MNRLYKILFTISNILLILMLVFGEVIFVTQMYSLQNVQISMFKEIIQFVLLLALLYFCVRFIFKTIVLRKKYSNKRKTIIARVVAIFMIIILVVIIKESITYVNFIVDFVEIPVHIYIIIMILLGSMIEIVIRNKEHEYGLRELVLQILSICFFVLVIIIFFRNINLFKLFDYSKDRVGMLSPMYTSSWHIITFNYYLFFMAIPAILINIYTLICIKVKKK